MPVATPASRARRRRVPATSLPPSPPQTDRRSTARNLAVTVAGRRFLVGPALEGDPAMSTSYDAASGLMLAVRDVRGRLRSALGTEAEVLERGVTVGVDGITYGLRSLEYESGLVSLTMEDDVATRLRRYRRFLAVRRTATFGLPQFARRLVNEASRPPLARITAYIPELSDRVDIPAPNLAGAVTKRQRSGTGASTIYTVKGVRATAAQRVVIDGILTEAARLGASRSVMVACVMCATQESLMGKASGVTTGNDDTGIYQQGRNWISVAGARDPALSTRAFLLGGHAFGRSAPGWKQLHKNLRSVPGGYERAIKKVQVSVGGYSRWQAEASKTVSTWTGGGEAGTVAVAQDYEFTRGERKGRAESSWDAIGRYATPRKFHRWAYGNAFWLASDVELRAAAPSLEIDGNEDWLVSEPAFSWAPGRLVAELKVKVLAERWGLMPGAVVIVNAGDTSDGRYLVAGTAGTLVGPEVEVTLHRPIGSASEPKQEVTTLSVRGATVTGGGGGGGGGGGFDASSVKSAAKSISGKGYPYAWGGGHPRCGTPSRSTRPGESQIGFDCSGYVGAILALVGHGFHLGQSVPASSGWAGWGRPGRGRSYTVWYNYEHIWIEFSDGTRADTSPHGCGSSGPRYRTCRRSAAGFTPRHWPGN